MYWYQIASLCTFGVIWLPVFWQLIFAIRFKEQPFQSTSAWVLAVCTVELIVVFLGIK